MQIAYRNENDKSKYSQTLRRMLGKVDFIVVVIVIVMYDLINIIFYEQWWVRPCHCKYTKFLIILHATGEILIKSNRNIKRYENIIRIKYKFVSCSLSGKSEEANVKFIKQSHARRELLK